MNKINKLLITIDGVRKDRVGFYNKRNIYITPNLSKIAKESVVFNDMFACGTSTAMCFASLFNGQYQKNFQRKNFGDNNNPYKSNIFTDLENRGYKTFICLNKRFEYPLKLINTIGRNTKIWWTGEKNKKNKSIGSLRPLEQVKYISTNLKKIKDPYFLWVHLWGFSAPKKKFTLSTSTDYDARVKEMDEAIGYIFKQFKKNTEMFFFSDHGYALFEKNKWAYGKDAGNLVGSVTNVPTIIYNGKNIGINNNLVSQTNIRKLINNSSEALKLKSEFAYCESRYIEEYDIALAIRYKNFKYIIEYNKRKSQLYDVMTDPDENINLISNKINKLKRDKFGNHPEIKPYIIRYDWAQIEIIYKKLDNIAKNFYDFSSIQNNIKMKNFIKSSKLYFIYKKFFN